MARIHPSRMPIVVALGLGLLVVGGCKEDEPGLAARFDYSVPARFAVPDPRDPGGLYEIYVDGELHPDTWTIRLDACASTGRIVRYAWSIDGTSVGETAACAPFEYDLPAEGTYEVSLLVEDDEGDTREVSRPIVVHDILIFGIGDSYGSGEGSPDVELSLDALERVEAARTEVFRAAAALASPERGASGPRPAESAAHADALAALAEAEAAAAAQWQNQRCHRSARSAQARAAQLLEERDAHTSVTFVHLACSGARVFEGLLRGYEGIEPIGDELLEPQIDRVAELADGHEIDALVVSIGGNDANFADVILACTLADGCHEAPFVVDPGFADVVDGVCSVIPSFEDECNEYFDDILGDPESLDAVTIFDVHSKTQDVDGQDIGEDGNDDLPANYAALAAAIVGTLGMDPARVYLTAYPDISRDRNGAYCGWDATPIFSSIRAQPPGIWRDELIWADTHAATELAATMRTATETHGWRFVDDIASRSRRHGYCSSESWVVRLQQTFFSQGDSNGAYHPNPAGTAVYADVIADAIAEDF